MKMQSDETHTAIGFGNALMISENATDAVWYVELVNDAGEGITVAQFEDSVRTHGFARACRTFKKLGDQL